MAAAKIQRMCKAGKQKPTIRQAKTSEIPEEIQCKICRNRYEDPKLLPCLHTFCKSCLEKSLESHGGSLYCPVCPTEIKSTELSELKNNFMVSNMLQTIDLKEGVDAKKCDSCDEDVIATSRCFECSDFLCPSCVEAHKRVRFTKTHQVVAIKNLDADAIVRTPSCTTHLGEALKMYCKQCREPVCGTCLRYEHDEHLLITLKEAVENTEPKLNALLIATQAKIPILQRKLKGLQSSKHKLESKVDEVIKEIQGTSARILLAVKRREKDLYKMLRKIHDTKSDQLESKELALENDLIQVLDSCDFAEELGKIGDEAMVLHFSEMTCARLKSLSAKEEATVPEISENEIEYLVEEKQVLDELKIYGKVLSKEQKVKMDEKVERRTERNDRKRENRKNEKDDNEIREEKKATVERRTGWLQTMTNPRKLVRRLSFGGDEIEDKKPEIESKVESQGDKTLTALETQSNNGKKTQEKGFESILKSEKQEKNENEHIYAVPDKMKSPPKPPRLTKDPKSPPLTKKDPKSAPLSTKDPKSLPLSKKDPWSHPLSTKDPQSSPASLKESPRSKAATTSPNTSFERSYLSSTESEPSKSHSILKQPSQENIDQSHEPNLAQVWTVRSGSTSSGAHSQSYLPSLCLLTKNRRGRPREVEIQLESPDNSIVSAQILDHKNGTYTIFYCPLTPGEHNMYVNIGGKKIKHGKKVLNFYGKFSEMGAEELFLARRVLSCIRWQVTPGFVELKNKKLKANPDIYIKH